MKPLTFAVLFLWLLPNLARAGSIVNTKHNLSASTLNSVRALTETEICIFCHTPHNSGREAPLWNRYSSGQTYQPYASTTSKAHPGQPTGDSKLCLSCHDGTVALGMVRSRTVPIPLQGGVTLLTGTDRLGTDLSDDHPISFAFDSALAAANTQLTSPSSLNGAVRLDNTGQLQCTTCHNAHDNQFGKFLVMNNSGSALCITCHNQNYWSSSAHSTSTKTWNGLGTDPWPHTENTTVKTNACENCHHTHTAGNKARLLNFAGEEGNCFSCHNGNVAAKNIQADFAKASVHTVAGTAGVHDPTEDPVNSTRHVECVDCHNPHAAKSVATAPPIAQGELTGVRGINTSGTLVNPIVNQYELCYRCHADSTNRGPSRVTRQFVETNTRTEFQSTNASFHPVTDVGKNPSGPSLIAPWTTASKMFCTDCHNSNTGPGAGGTGPSGPHGSIYTPILERRLEITDNQTESAAIYALCYKCHSRTSILANQGFRYHKNHIVDEKAACTTCHDSHGVVTKTHLINFNTTYVTKSTRLNSGPTYTDTSPGRGSCTLTCHGKDHDNWTY